MKFKIVIMVICFASIANAVSVPTQLQTVSNKAMSQFEQFKKNIGGASVAPKTQKVKAKLDQQTLQETVSFLSKDINYKGKPELQRGFLNRLQLTLDINDTQKENILNMIKARELRDRKSL